MKKHGAKKKASAAKKRGVRKKAAAEKKGGGERRGFVGQAEESHGRSVLPERVGLRRRAVRARS
jgi:hypothetical protein